MCLSNVHTLVHAVAVPLLEGDSRWLVHAHRIRNITITYFYTFTSITNYFTVIEPFNLANLRQINELKSTNHLLTTKNKTKNTE